MIKRKEELNKENKYSHAHPKSLFKQYFEVIPPVADAIPSIIKENAQRRVESAQEMRRLAKENAPSDAPKKADVRNDSPVATPPSSTTEPTKSVASALSSSSSSSSFSSVENDKQEIELKLFLREMEQGREKCELLYGHKEGSDSSQTKQLGVEASKTTSGRYRRTLGSTVTRGSDGWSEFVITYDNKFILNYTELECEKAKADKFGFNHQTMGSGTFLKAAGKIKIIEATKETARKIIISPYSEHLELGLDYISIILFVLREKGLDIQNENISIVDEQGASICERELITPVYLNERRFPLAKVIAENKELDVKGMVSRLFLNIDDSILSAGNKKDIGELITKRDHLKTAIVNLFLALIRNDLSNDLFKVTEQTIDAKLSEINKNSELVKNKFDFSVKAVVDETIYNNLCAVNNKLELMKNKDGATLKNIFAKIASGKHIKLNESINIQAVKNNPEVNPKKSKEKAIHEKLSEIKRNIESITKDQAKKAYQVTNLKEVIDSVIYKNLCGINESILSIENTDKVSLKEFMGKTARQNFCEVNEAIQLINDRHGVALNFVNNELDVWLHHIFNLKFQHENTLGVVGEKGESIFSEALKYIETNLKEIKAGSLPQRHINEHDFTRSPFIQFYSENPTKTCIALLRDYTKGGFFRRLLTGAWWRHHIKTVDTFLKEYDNQHYPDNLSVQAIYRELFKLNEGTLAEYTGKKATLYARLLFCEKLENGSPVDSVVPVVNEAPSQREALSNPGPSSLNSVVEEASAMVPPMPSPLATSTPIPIKQPEQPEGGMPSFASTYVSSSGFYREAKQDSPPPLSVPAIVVEEVFTPPAATSSPKLTRALV